LATVRYQNGRKPIPLAIKEKMDTMGGIGEWPRRSKRKRKGREERWGKKISIANRYMNRAQKGLIVYPGEVERERREAGGEERKTANERKASLHINKKKKRVTHRRKGKKSEEGEGPFS